MYRIWLSMFGVTGSALLLRAAFTKVSNAACRDCAAGLDDVTRSVRKSWPLPIPRYCDSPLRKGLSMMVWTALVTLFIRVWALFQPAPQKTKSTSTCVSTGPPLSTTLRLPALPQITVGTVRSSRYSTEGRHRSRCGWRKRREDVRNGCRNCARRMFQDLPGQTDPVAGQS